MQKNGIPGKLIGSTCTSASIVCPHPPSNCPPSSTHVGLHKCLPHATLSYRIADHQLKVHICIAATLLGLNVVTTTAGTLHCTVTTALLQQGKVPLEQIKLVGHYWSNEVFKYLYAQSEPLMNPLASTMLASIS
jgi:hypothetical protein